MGAAIAASIRQTRDIAARYGGEEFALLLPETDEDSAALVADRIRQNVERLGLEHKDSPHGIVTISAGVCSLASDATDEGPDTLLRSADLALYAAKTAGRNLVARSSVASAALGRWRDACLQAATSKTLAQSGLMVPPSWLIYSRTASGRF